MQTILAVDDAKDTLMLLEFDLQAEGYQVLTANDGASALSILENENVDMLLLDLYMPGISGLDTLKAIRENQDLINLPVIMLSASDDEDEIVSALEFGAHDYVTKPYIAKVLLARIRNALRLKEKTMKLENLAKTDFLTEVNNKGEFEHQALKSISQMSRINHNLVIAMLDIDHFKAVNDTYGHDAGDIVLKHFAKELTKTFRDYDIIGRVGGEEFAVCMPNTAQLDGYSACERFRVALENLIIDIGNDQTLSITASIGVASAQHIDGGYDFSRLMHLADQFLYQAKEQSRNKVVSHATPIMESEVNQQIESDIMANESDEKYAGIDYQVGVNNVLGDENLFKEILKMFYDDHHQDGANIQTAISNADQSRLKHLVHTLKGVACSIGAMQLFEKTKELDVAVNEGNTGSYQSLFDNVAHELERVIGGIKSELDIR
ncbi:diguanylate cyclase [Thalassotalea sp. M1531]|uniref:diguanylate cyclase n=1 Tax=Thalassotalea algicola TaxID=2716224 RepID=A0A7Y0LBZ6_9GAMM|nr:diguanylate cyclase [Thalassotalea algicola]NMP31388.1 diguanylate cyclase [Thalassotalea algicola]